MVLIDTTNAHSCIHAHSYMEERGTKSKTEDRITDACVRHRCAHMCAQVRAHTPGRMDMGAHASAPTHTNAFRRRGPRAAWLAGVPLGVGIQREHRRVEHRGCHRLVPGMRRFRPGGAPPQASRMRSTGLR